MGTPASSSLPLPLFQQADTLVPNGPRPHFWVPFLAAKGAARAVSACSPSPAWMPSNCIAASIALPSLQTGRHCHTRSRTSRRRSKQLIRTLLSQPDLDKWDDRIIDEMVEHFADVPCPALAPDGTCDIYAFRPITCRTMGIPTESEGMVQGACTVQTAVPIVRLSPIFRKEMDRLAEHEAVDLSILSRDQTNCGR